MFKLFPSVKVSTKTTTTHPSAPMESISNVNHAVGAHFLSRGFSQARPFLAEEKKTFLFANPSTATLFSKRPITASSTNFARQISGFEGISDADFMKREGIRRLTLNEEADFMRREGLRWLTPDEFEKRGAQYHSAEGLKAERERLDAKGLRYEEVILPKGFEVLTLAFNQDDLVGPVFGVRAAFDPAILQNPNILAEIKRDTFSRNTVSLSQLKQDLPCFKIFPEGLSYNYYYIHDNQLKAVQENASRVTFRLA